MWYHVHLYFSFNYIDIEEQNYYKWIKIVIISHFIERSQETSYSKKSSIEIFIIFRSFFFFLVFSLMEKIELIKFFIKIIPNNNYSIIENNKMKCYLTFKNFAYFIIVYHFLYIFFYACICIKNLLYYIFWRNKEMIYVYNENLHSLFFTLPQWTTYLKISRKLNVLFFF